MLFLNKIYRPLSIGANIQKIALRCSSYDTHNSQDNHYDVIISGGGIIGCTVACTLGKNAAFSNRKILLLESNKNKNVIWSEKYSNRVVSLNPGTKKLLQQLNVWQHIENKRFAKVKRLQVMDALSDASITFGEEKSEEDVSFIVENDLIIESLKKELSDIKNVEVLYESKINTMNLPSSSHHVQISLKTPKDLTCELLIGCDGVNSQVRKMMNSQYLNWNYDNRGIVATLKLSEEIDNCIAWQRFLPNGPIALLPLTSTKSSLVWSTTEKESKHLFSLSDQEFTDAVNEALWKVHKRSNIVNQAAQTFDSFIRYANIPVDVSRRYPPKIASIEEGSRASFPLGFGHAATYIGHGVVLVGDAAHRVHPLAGQGVNLGFADVACLNKVLTEAINAGSSLGDVSYLKDYERERQKHNVSMMVAVEGMYRLYRTDFTPIVLLRTLGLQATDILAPVKKMIINQASI